MEKYLRKVIEGVSNTRGEAFFNSICLQLNNIIQADYCFIGRLDSERYVSRTIALVAKGQIADNFEYSLADTPCANVADDSTCFYPSKVCNLFPKDQLLIDMNIDGYLGTPLHDSKGEVMGLIVALYENEIQEKNKTETLFKIFSGRISAEMERVEYEQQLSELNHSLEAQVEQRTAELKNALANLHAAQDQLIESEKLASLGKLVASVAHEVNTPLGVAITAESMLSESFKELESLLDQGSQKDALSQHTGELREDLGEAISLIGRNLERARDLIENFKRTAVDQSNLTLEVIDLNTYLKNQLTVLSPMLKKKHAQVKLNVGQSMLIQTFPGCISQILTNLISNSVSHAFEQNVENQITIDVKQQGDELILIYKDNGKGLDEHTRRHIFDPFYTTARGQGGTGLGMSIVYNLVKQSLYGEIALLDTKDGFAVQIQLPLKLSAQQARSA